MNDIASPANPDPDWAWTAEQLTAATGGQWYGQPPSTITHITTDSRRLTPGSLFLALQGERFDAHEFVAQAAQAGAAAAIVSRRIDSPLPQLVVADTRIALGQLGAARRRAMTGLTVVALTGSSGKTTTKELLGSILQQAGPTLITRGNLNNDLGVPMMLLELKPSHRFAVMELGANHQGEIAYTAGLVQPQAVAVLNIGTAHLGEFGGREGIARAKSEIFTALPANGTAVIPQVDDFAAQLRTAVGEHACLRFGLGGEVRAEAIVLHTDCSEFTLVTPQGSVPVQLQLAGRHNIDNALAAAALALAIGRPLIEIAHGLQTLSGVSGRLQFHRVGTRIVIDDTYNANPHAMQAAADVLIAQPVIAENRLMLIGDMAELGDEAATVHAELGQALRQRPLQLWAVGQYAEDVIQQQPPHRAFKTQADMKTALDDWLAARTDQPIALLCKGSRSAQMENIVHHLLESR